MPKTESLANCVERVLPFWVDGICPAVLAQKRVLVVAHGNSLRALVKHFDHLSNEAIISVNIPTAIPLVYEFDENLNAIKNYYLSDPEELKKEDG